MSSKPSPARDWIRGALRKGKTLTIFKRKTDGADEKLQISASVDPDEGLDFSNMKGYRVFVLYKVRFNRLADTWVGQKIKRLFGRT